MGWPIKRMVIKVHLVDSEGCNGHVQVCGIDRELTTVPLEMSLAEGLSLRAAAQPHSVGVECEGIASAYAHCA